MNSPLHACAQSTHIEIFQTKLQASKKKLKPPLIYAQALGNDARRCVWVACLGKPARTALRTAAVHQYYDRPCAARLSIHSAISRIAPISMGSIK